MQMCAYILTCLNFGHGWTEPLSEFVLLVLNEYGLLYGSDYPVTQYFSSDAWKLTIWQILVPNQGYNQVSTPPSCYFCFQKTRSSKVETSETRVHKPVVATAIFMHSLYCQHMPYTSYSGLFLSCYRNNCLLVIIFFLFSWCTTRGQK